MLKRTGKTTKSNPLILLIPSELMGRGERKRLGSLLVGFFLHAMVEGKRKPDQVIFFNSGIKLVLDDSPVLEDLRKLEEQGVELLACGTCLKYYHVVERLAVGKMTDMYTIADRLLGPGRVVSL